MRYQYRITKYNPRYRGPDGEYRRPDWTSYSDIGKSFGGRRLTRDVYGRIENLYVDAVVSLLRDLRVERLRITRLECHVARLKSWNQKRWISLTEARRFARLALRERLWGVLSAPNRAFVHFGFDYYLYVGLHKKLPGSLQRVRASGLFVEEMKSPYSRAA